MSWQSLNNHELQALRKMLMLEASEAAEFVGNVSTRTWQYWESGRNKVPADVEEEIYALHSMMNECIEGILQAGEQDRNIRWYHSFEEFKSDYPLGNKAWWKVHQAVCADLFANTGDDIELRSDIDVDKNSYIYKFFSRTRNEDIEHERQEKLFRESGAAD